MLEHGLPHQNDEHKHVAVIWLKAEVHMELANGDAAGRCVHAEPEKGAQQPWHCFKIHAAHKDEAVNKLRDFLQELKDRYG